MLAVQQHALSVEEFLQWIDDQEDRHELVDGLPVRMMAGAKQSHNVVVGNLSDLIRSAGKNAGCRTTTSDTAVVTGPNHVRYPDIVVDCGPPDPDAKAASQPTIVVEVLSKSTAGTDLIEKLDEYRSIASMQAIMFVDPNMVSVLAYKRGPEGEWLLEKYSGLEQIVDLPSIGASVPLSVIYDTFNPQGPTSHQDRQAVRIRPLTARASCRSETSGFSGEQTMATYEEIRDELLPIHDHICLVYDSELLRLVGIAQDDSDFYYHCRDRRGADRYMSAVGWIVSLKDHYPADGYLRLENVFALNGCPPSGAFVETVLPDMDLNAYFRRRSEEGGVVDGEPQTEGPVSG